MLSVTATKSMQIPYSFDWGTIQSQHGRPMEAGKQDSFNQLSDEQKYAFEMCQSGENIFLTGGAGSGKSYVVREFMKDKSDKQLPILASTGAAAVLLGGRTFHSFFGLGIMEGGPQATFQRVLNDSKTISK